MAFKDKDIEAFLNDDSDSIRLQSDEEIEAFLNDVPAQPSNPFVDVAKQAAGAALAPFNPESASRPIAPTSGNPLMVAIQAAGQTLKEPARISPTLSQPGQIAGEAVSEKLGGGLLGKGAGFLTSIALDPQSYATMGANKLPIKAGGLKPLSGGPADVLFTPAELSGKTGASTLEAALAKSPTGGPIIDRFRALRSEKLDDFIDAVQARLGTDKSPNIAGNEIKEALLSEQAANKAFASNLYKSLPQDARVPVKGFVSTYNEMMEELPEGIKKIVQKHIKTEPTPPISPNAGEFKGVTSADNTFGVGYETSAKATESLDSVSLRDVQLLRSKLGAIQKSGGLDGFYATKLKQALTSDVDALGTSGSALDNMVGKETADSLRTATNYYREMKTLENSTLVKRLKNAQISDLPEIVFRQGRVEDVLTAKAALGDGFIVAQRSFFNDILRSKNIGKTLEKYDADFLKHALTDDQRQALSLVGTLKTKAGSAEKIAPMTGSSRMNAMLALWHGLSTNPTATVATGLVAPYYGAKAYLGGINTAINPARAGMTGVKTLDAIRSFLNQRGQ